MNRLGVHALVWTGRLDAESVAFAADRTIAAGYDLLEIPLLDPAAFDADAAADVLSSRGLAVTGSLGLSRRTDISGEDPDAVAAGEKLLREAVDVVARLGSSHLVGVIYGALAKHDAPCTARGRRNGIEVLRRVADHARGAGITLGIEVVNRYETNVVNTAREALRHLDEVDRDNVVLHLDTYHMNIEEDGLLTPVLEAGSRLGYVHIGESHRGYLGSGTVDFMSFYRGLAEIGYAGPIVFESFSSAVVDPVLSNMLAVWRDLWDDSDDLARHALDSMRTGIRAAARHLPTHHAEPEQAR
jgi:D-psicose/D-tagatose/L-ribulose 3-epimerase